MTSAFAAAAQQASQNTAPAGAPAESQILPEQESQLFSGQGGASFPSLFNKTHYLGTERTGIVTSVRDAHSRFYSTDGPGSLKYWENTTSGQKGSKPTPDAVSKINGKPNTPILDTLITVKTDYRMDAQECAAIGRKPEFIADDDGTRVFAAGGFDLKVVREALIAYNDANAATPLRKNADLVGKRITVVRASQRQNPGGNPSWNLTVKFDNA